MPSARIVAAEHAKKPVTAVLIDEVQFMTADQVRQLVWIVDELKVPVMAYGLKNNVYGTLFSDAIVAMMALADDFQEIKQLCHCGRKATMILKFDRNGEAVRSGEVVEIGGEGRYVSVCRRHWTKGDIGPAGAAIALIVRRWRRSHSNRIASPRAASRPSFRARGWAASNASIRRVASTFV